jgi:hypothetical protein
MGKLKERRCPTCHRLVKRSQEANARYWLLLHTIAEKIKPEGQSYDAETWHKWAKSKWLGAEECKLPSGKTIQILRSTADLDAAEFSDYMTKVEVWAGDHNAWLDSLETT